ncbi:MAG: porin family protein [Henriciella sp.]|nr:porin family protein [Henriciella sp.]
MRKTAFAAALFCAAFSPAAFAESELYLNFGGSSVSTDDANLTAITARGGIWFNDLIGTEFETSFGAGADDVDGVDFELENTFGGYVIAKYPVLPRVDVLGRLGYTTGEFQAATNGVSTDAEADGFAFGLGGEVMLTDQFGLRGDYTRIEPSDDGLDGGVNVFAVTGVFKFGTVR